MLGEGEEVEPIDPLNALSVIFIEAFSIFPGMGECWQEAFLPETISMLEK